MTATAQMLAPAGPETVESACAGDRAAFEQLVAQYTPLVFRVALRIVGNAADAEDCVQDVWLAAWRSIGRYRGQAAFSTWLYRVTTNAALMLVRRRRPALPLDGLSDIGIDTPVSIEALAAADAVQRALRALTSDQRAVIVLREFEDLSYDQIATILDLSMPAVRSRLHRARIELCRALEDWR